jgi:Uri superfamily endonuclease
MLFGSGGGNGNGVGGNGGGVLLWNISQRMELNGLLALQGDNGVSGNSGGGSGGSVNMFTTNFTGHGEINVRGGDGSGTTGGGGAGGRIGIHCRYRYSYGGKFTNRGGDGGSSKVLTHGAAAGTTYVENNFRPLAYRILKHMKGTNNTYFQVDHLYCHMDNVGNLVPVPTMIMVNETVDYEFDEFEVTGHSRVIIYHPGRPVEVVIHKIEGDRTGQIHMRSDQTAYIEYVESIKNVTEADVSYIIDFESEVIFPTEVHMQGINTTIDGMMTGVHHLYVEDNAVVSVSATSQTALLDNGTYVYVSEEGNFSLPTINIKQSGTLEFRKILNDMTVTTPFLEIKYQGTMLMNHGYIDAGIVDLEPEGVINLDSRGYEAMKGYGVGSGTSGGSYGGVGGGSDDSIPYGSLFSPKDLGSGGAGSSNAGSGGGYIHMKVGRNIHIDGVLSANGSEASSGNAGGGSGGSVFIESYKISGHGIISTYGGDGNGNGGGGSGGRIALHVGSTNLYGGQYLSRGGDGSSDGGPGTIYKFESQRGPQYRELKYDPRLNKTLIEPEHSKLLVDNGNLTTDNPAMVMENNSIYYEFDEVQVEGYSYVHFYHPHGIKNLTVMIHELTGNKKGMVRVQKRQQIIVEFVESTHTYIDAPCGFHVDVGGELVMPTDFFLTTERFILSGRMVGVENLFIERNAELTLSEQAHTSQLKSLVMWYTDAPYDSGDPGVTSVGTLEVKNLGKITVTMDPLNPIMTAGNFTVKNGGIIETDTLKVTLNATDMTIEKGGTVTGNGHGYGAEKGKGPGSRASHYSSGGGHGSAGKLYLLPEILYFLVQTQKRLVFFWKCMRDICL